MKKLLLITCCLSIFIVSKAQEKRNPKLNVFIDCSNTWCDMMFVRTEINVVDFMLDRVAADVHVLITSLQNGSGGRQYQVIFYGQNGYKNVKDTLNFSTDPNATDFEKRDVLVKYLKLGLAPLVAKTGQVDAVSIDMKSKFIPDSVRVTSQTTDKWNYWVFQFGGNGNINMDQVYKSSELNGNFRLTRTTDDLKAFVGFFGGVERSSYEYDTDAGPLEVKVKNTNYRLNHSLVKSLNDHWSYGYEVQYMNNTFSNYRSSSYVLPQIEYSIFPYKDVNNRFVTLRYGIGPQYNVYYDTTIYQQTEELLWGHNAELNISFNQKWGVINTGISYKNYFHDWKINNIGIATEMEVRITGGLSVYVYLFGSLVHDQIYLSGEGATGEEVLSRTRQLESSYNFESYFGINYRFGSKLNNFVNPRFNSTFDNF